MIKWVDEFPLLLDNFVTELFTPKQAASFEKDLDELLAKTNDPDVLKEQITQAFKGDFWCRMKTCSWK